MLPMLRHKSSFPYVFGQGVGPAFSHDERLLGLVWATNTALIVEGQDLDDDGLTRAECVIEWAQLRVQQLPEGDATSCAVPVRIPRGFASDGDDSYCPEHLEIQDPHEICFQSGWGTLVRVPLPLPELVTVPWPRQRVMPLGRGAAP